MDWRAKAALMWSFHVLPGGSALHYAAQRHLTRSFPRRLDNLEPQAESYLRHFRVLDEELPGWSRNHLLEFGAGRDLLGNLLAWCYGVERQTVVDIVALLKPELVNHAIAAIQRQAPDDLVRAPERAISMHRPLEDLREIYSIDYRAPADARALDLADGSVDLVVTTTTLEHIPEPSLIDIFAEAARVMAPGATMSHLIDYSDHYSHSDPNLTPYAMLSHSNRAWRWLNPPDQYQNRLRHTDICRIISGAGFKLSYDEQIIPESGEEDLSAMTVHSDFDRYDLKELLPIVGHILAQPVN